MSWTAALIGGAFNAATSLIGTHMRNEAQKRESELAYNRMVAEKQKENAYNSASAQMARLQAAGLNPNLMYDNGQQAAAGMQEGIPEYQPAPIENAAAPLSDVGTSTINAMIGLKDLKNKTLETEARIFLDYTEGDLNISRLHLTDAQTNEINTLLGWKVNEFDAKIKNINQATEESKANKALIEQKAKESIQIIKESEQRISNMIKEGEKIDAETYCMLALLTYKQNFLEASAEERAAMALEAYERMKYIGSYFTLESDKFDFEMKSFYDSLDWDKDSFHQSLKQGYWNLGVHTGVQVLSLAAQCATPWLGAGASVGKLFGRSPVAGVYGSSTTVHPYNYKVGKTFTPATGKFVYRKPHAHK